MIEDCIEVYIGKRRGWEDPCKWGMGTECKSPRLGQRPQRRRMRLERRLWKGIY